MGKKGKNKGAAKVVTSSIPLESTPKVEMEKMVAVVEPALSNNIEEKAAVMLEAENKKVAFVDESTSNSEIKRNKNQKSERR